LKFSELEHLENSNIIDIIKDESISIEKKIIYFKGLESKIKNSKGQEVDETLYNTLSEIKSFIKDKTERIKSYDSLAEHEQEIINLVNLVDEHNNLVDAKVQITCI